MLPPPLENNPFRWSSEHQQFRLETTAGSKRPGLRGDSRHQQNEKVGHSCQPSEF